MTTTFEKFKGMQAGNYCTNPRIDVEIIDDPTRCNEPTCGRTIIKTGDSYWPKWVHEDTGDSDGHYVCPRASCRYCGTNDPQYVGVHQYAWYDATECSRCGGVTGYALGD